MAARLYSRDYDDNCPCRYYDVEEPPGSGKWDLTCA